MYLTTLKFTGARLANGEEKFHVGQSRDLVYPTGSLAEPLPYPATPLHKLGVRLVQTSHCYKAGRKAA